MCLIALHHAPADSAPDSRHAVVLIANRDELHARPTAPLAAWDDAPSLVAGRDLEAGGTWLGVHRRGRFAAITNVRDPDFIPEPPVASRGLLVRQALETDDLEHWLHRQQCDHALAYAGFNLLVGDGEHLWHLRRDRHGATLDRVTPGTHGLSNASLDTPWPKLEKVTQALTDDVIHQRVETLPQARRGFSDQRRPEDERLPDTGVGLDLERFLSPAFIVGDDYGTRATTSVVLVRGDVNNGVDEHFVIHEQRFGPGGSFLGETRLTLPISRR
ncbi:NRDE family protein [Halomonas sp. DP5Y7-2]|uniref:NRDE family protein n=1 Tax=Halomonas sp. DP5Y7-2 TaxID=2859076 RepID=UPI001C99C9D2|nr:NRDE family protein [Halomonas sp. DP5Y7-2]MBY5984211.1 NRDE family protein [Halomonas sp. DP5Y7-2]